ncbi:MAG: hypothetical protein ACKOBL_13975 [Chloroflexota bacterium]
MATCSNCGNNFGDTFQFCPHCGSPKSNSQHSSRSIAASEMSSHLNCPKCHRMDNVLKVSAIVQGNTHQISGQVPVSRMYQDSEGWHERTSYESYNATQQSTLARKLTPPQKPAKGNSLFGSIVAYPVSVVVILGGMGSISGIYDGITKGIALNIFLGIAGGVGIIMLLFVIWRLYLYFDKPHKEKHVVSVAKWKDSISKWDNLYYCTRDDCIFFPGQSSAFHISNLYEAINWYPKK